MCASEFGQISLQISKLPQTLDGGGHPMRSARAPCHVIAAFVVAAATVGPAVEAEEAT
jgi:hypothetical protein